MRIWLAAIASTFKKDGLLTFSDRLALIAHIIFDPELSVVSRRIKFTIGNYVPKINSFRLNHPQIDH